MNIEQVSLFGLLAASGLLLRAAVSLHPYSGAYNPPMFGDYEAQRHWQEITVNLPAREWYENSTRNDLLYWGLDYPPLTAYHSLLVGKVAHALDPQFVALQESRGFEDDRHKLFMRGSVLVADLLFYIPALILTCSAVQETFSQLKRKEWDIYLHVLVCVLYPGQILIDNGHFQYNNVSLGLAALAVAALLVDRNLLGAFLFALALNYKQMELYHALPFFFYLLGSSFRDRYDGFNAGQGIVRVLSIGAVVLVTFLLIWLPWLESWAGLMQVVHRIFPLDRGVFEDKVSNVWCIVNIFYKIKDHFTNHQMAVICMNCTLAVVLPICVHLLLNPKKDVFLLSLLNSSLGFFLFSFQVHEKSILLAAIPALILFPKEPFFCFWFLEIATFSMLPLLARDGLIFAFLGLNMIYFIVTKFTLKVISDSPRQHGVGFDFFALRELVDRNFKPWNVKGRKGVLALFYLSLYGMISLTILLLFAPPPRKLPHLFPLAISAYSCFHFVMFFMYFAHRQFFIKESRV